jgi:hypothetical protein
MSVTDTIAQIVLSLPERPRTGDVLRVLAQAEQAGYDRALAAMTTRGVTKSHDNGISTWYRVELDCGHERQINWTLHPGSKVPCLECGESCALLRRQAG